MKKYMLLINIIFLSFSCKHNNDYTPFSVAIPIGDETYYYKSCKTESSEYICKFKCEKNIDISELKDKKIDYKCNILEGALPDSEMRDLFNKDIMNNIVSQIRNYNTLNILPVDYDEFITFDTIFSKYEQNSDKIDWTCRDSICMEKPGTLLNVWKKYKKDSITIYQNQTSGDLGILQWVMLYRHDNNGKIIPLDLTYYDAKKACEEYEFENLTNWSLPADEFLVEAIKLGIGKELNRNIEFYDFKNASVWDLKGKAYGLMRMSETIEPKKVSTNQKLYVICSRYMENTIKNR